MAPYIMQDSIDKDWEECINESKQLMDGHKWQAFCLDMSFIGWYLLGALAFGVGTFFVVSYHQTARANFSLALIGWYLLGALAFGIGTFFVVPYHQTARANFYLALIATHERTSSNDFGSDFTVQE